MLFKLKNFFILISKQDYYRGCMKLQLNLTLPYYYKTVFFQGAMGAAGSQGAEGMRGQPVSKYLLM